MILRSRSADIRYVVESDPSPMTPANMATYIKNGRSIEDTLEISDKHAPFDSALFEKWNGIMRDQIEPDLKLAYDNNYAAVMRYFGTASIKGNIRIHTVKMQQPQ